MKVLNPDFDGAALMSPAWVAPLVLLWRGLAKSTPALAFGFALVGTPWAQVQATVDFQEYPSQTSEIRTPSRTEIGASAQSTLTEFVMRDLEFTLSTWKAPSADRYGLEVWLNATAARLQKLNRMATDAELDTRVGQCITKVESMVDAYRQFLLGLDLINYTDNAVRVEGERTLLTNGSRVAGSFVQGSQLGLDMVKGLGRPDVTVVVAVTMGIVSGSSEALGTGGKVLERASKFRKLSALKETEVSERIGRLQRDVALKMDYLKDAANSLAKHHPEIRVPNFEHTDGVAQFDPDYTDSPFPHVAKAYRLVNTDRVAAAREFAAAAEAVPQSEGLFREVYAQYYKAPYHLLAGQLFEFESRSRRNTDLAGEAVRQFDAAIQTLSGDLSSVSYSFLISYARALAESGQTSRGREVARYMSELAFSDPLRAAAYEYDLACVYSLLGDYSKALDRLRQSYRLMPRRDPRALDDPLLAGLVLKNRFTFEIVVNNPLVGAWKSASERDTKSEYIFYVDGLFWQRRGSGSVERTSGHWAATERSTLRLSGRKGVADSESTFSVAGDVLTLTNGNNVFKFKRVSPAGLLDQGNEVESLTGRKLRSNGSWVWADGSEAPFARFMTTRTLANSNRLYWYTYEDPLVGRVDQQLSQGAANE